MRDIIRGLVSVAADHRYSATKRRFAREHAIILMKTEHISMRDILLYEKNLKKRR